MGLERRPNSHQRMGAQWAKRRAAALEAAAARQAKEGWDGGPWCECDLCERGFEEISPTVERVVFRLRANTVDHITPRRKFPLHLQHSDAPDGADHESNLRVMAHQHHSRRKDDKARGRKRV